jgi:hypothetical protein
MANLNLTTQQQTNALIAIGAGNAVYNLNNGGLNLVKGLPLVYAPDVTQQHTKGSCIHALYSSNINCDQTNFFSIHDTFLARLYFLTLFSSFFRPVFKQYGPAVNVDRWDTAIQMIVS